MPSIALPVSLRGQLLSGTRTVDPATSVQLYTRSNDTILDRANSIIERRA